MLNVDVNVNACWSKLIWISVKLSNSSQLLNFLSLSELSHAKWSIQWSKSVRHDILIYLWHKILLCLLIWQMACRCNEIGILSVKFGNIMDFADSIVTTICEHVGTSQLWTAAATSVLNKQICIFSRNVLHVN